MIKPRKLCLFYTNYDMICKLRIISFLNPPRHHRSDILLGDIGGFLTCFLNYKFGFVPRLSVLPRPPSILMELRKTIEHDKELG